MTKEPPVFQCRVAGIPRTVNLKPGMTRHSDPAKRRPIAHEHNPEATGIWRREVEQAARLRLMETGSPPIIDYPVRLLLVFAIHRPANPTYTMPVAKGHGDWDKLPRAVSDGLTAAEVWRDDRLVTDGRIVKGYAGTPRVAQMSPGVLIRIWPDDPGAELQLDLGMWEGRDAQ